MSRIVHGEIVIDGAKLPESEHVKWIQAKVAAACADTRPALTTEQVLERLNARYARVQGPI
jgi:hypothetical protein